MERNQKGYHRISRKITLKNVSERCSSDVESLRENQCEHVIENSLYAFSSRLLQRTTCHRK